MRLHLDHNATTPLRLEARERWLEVVDALGGNPSSLHAAGRRARAVIDDARAQVAGALGVLEDELLFTSGGTESNNLALIGVLDVGPEPERARRALVTTAVEHSSVLGPARALERRGHPLHILGVDAEGMPDLESLRQRLEGDGAPATLVSVMTANNEVGTVPDLAALRTVLESAPGARPFLHTDAAQGLGRLPLELRDGPADLASFSAHKVGGPVGTGVLWRRKGVPLAPLLHGGEQEAGLRPGTEDAAGIAAAARAIELAVNEREDYHARLAALVQETWHALAARVPQLELLGPALDSRTLGLERGARASRLPNTLCLRVPSTDGKVLVTRLDPASLEASAGSACASGSLEPSHVLLAMGLDANEARAGLRLSLGRDTSRDECMQAVDLLGQLLAPSHAT